MMAEDVIVKLLDYGITAGIAVYLVMWITKKLNGSIDRLIEKIDKLGKKIDVLVEVLSVECRNCRGDGGIAERRRY